jgi:hypothetical protein
MIRISTVDRLELTLIQIGTSTLVAALAVLALAALALAAHHALQAFLQTGNQFRIPLAGGGGILRNNSGFKNEARFG